MKSKAIFLTALIAALVVTAVIAVAVRAQGVAELGAKNGDQLAATSGIGTDRLVQPKGVTDSGVYIIQLKAPSLAMYTGGIDGLAATSPQATQSIFLEQNSATDAYVSYLKDVQTEFVSSLEQNLGHTVDVRYTYQYAFNGVAIQMTPAEAAATAAMPQVRRVFRETIEQMDTDAGPAWIGAPTIWDGSATGSLPGTEGEGVVVAILDSGINHAHPSFAAVGGDGYVTVNPLGTGNYVPGSHCATTPSFCNDKLIGAWDMVNDVGDPTSPEDSDGHGSHTASTTAGNVVTATLSGPTGITMTNRISGVAPHANIIAYDVCVDGCPGAALLAAVNQVVADNMYIMANSNSRIVSLNYSISGGGNPYNDVVEMAFLDATAAGVFVSTSAGNSGPGAGTVAHISPWVMTTAASTHDRLMANSVVNMTGGDTTPPGDIPGQSFTTGYGPAAIVYAGDYGDPLCPAGEFAPGTFNGEIVVCDRGIYGRVEKAQSVLDGGAGGFVLADNGAGQVTDAYPLPGTHIKWADGVALKAWIASGSGHMASISGTTQDFDDSYGDIMAGFSSRGPAAAIDILKPDITAPGVSIWAAVNDDGSGPPDYGLLSGTSMSSPHDAGSAALIAALHPTWTPYQIKSALMTTAYDGPTLFKEDGVTPADPFDLGSGRVDLSQAGMAALVLNETPANFQAANPYTGTLPLDELNLANFNNEDCSDTCTWSRELQSSTDITVTWTATSSSADGIALTIDPITFTLAPGETQVINVTADTSAAAYEDWIFGQVLLTGVEVVPPPPEEGNVIYLPIILKPAATNGTPERAISATQGGTAVPDAHFPVSVIRVPAVPPIIDVDPVSLSSSQDTGVTTTMPLTVSNLGLATLYWDIYEDGGSSLRGGGGWSDNFDSYATGSQMHGQGGWKGWDNSPSAGAIVTDVVSMSAPNSVEILGGSDLVHEYSGYTSGLWNYTAYQYIPSSFVGNTYFILLNQYADGGPYNWSTQVTFNDATDLVVNDGVSGGTLPIVYDEWVEIRIEINLNTDSQSFYYDDQLLYTGSWTVENGAPGTLTIGAVDLYANGASAVYYDDISLTEVIPLSCQAVNDMPWVSVSPDSGSAAGGESDVLDVTFDSTGMLSGTYTGNLCASSNDPVTPVVEVPITLTVTSDPPLIDTDQSAITSTQAADTQITQTLTIMNIGGADLDWTIDEAENTLQSAIPAAPVGAIGQRGGQQTQAAGSVVNYVGSNAVLGGPSVTPTGGLSEGFDDITSLPGDDWYLLNHSEPLGTTGWFQGNDTVFPSHQGAPTAYIGANFNNTAGAGTISNWLLTPVLDLSDGSTFSFWTMRVPGSSFEDRLQVRMSLNGASTDIGTTSTDVGDFATLLLDINPTYAPGGYPQAWTEYVLTLSGIGSPTTGRVALRYFVEDAGPSGNNSDYIGIDTVNYTPNGGGTGCDSPSDVSWLSVDPTSGTTAPSNGTAVEVTYDSTGLASDTYGATLCIDSNDPTTPRVEVPVTLIVENDPPIINVNPALVVSTQPTDSVRTLSLSVGNIGGSDLDWTIDEAAPVPVTAPALSSPVAVVERVTSSAQCAQYENYAGLEPEGYAEHCGVTSLPSVTNSLGSFDPTDIGYVQDLRAATGQNLKSFTLNNFATQTVAGQNTRPTFALDFDPTATTLYAIDNTTRELGTLSLVDATFAVIAPTSGISTTDNISGLTIDPATGVAYVSSLPTTGGLNLYTLDLGTGAATLIGSDTTVNSIVDIAIGPQGVMYGHSIATDSIYTIDTTTGTLTLVGLTGFNANFAQGMDFDNADGTLYIFLYIGAGANEYGTVDLVTGAVTSLSSSNPLGEFEGATQTTGTFVPSTCSTTGDIPWASVNPASGSNGGGTSTMVDVTFDSTGMSTGVYTGTLCVNSNDPVTPLVTVPITMEVVAAAYRYNDTAAYNFIDISTTGTPLGLTDDGVANVTMPFTFTFHSVASTLVRVGNNGGIIFDATTGSVAVSNTALPSATSPMLRIYPFWDDIDADTGNVYYETQGTAPNRMFIVQWHDRPHFSNSADHTTFQVILYEGSNEILFQYADVNFSNPLWDNGASATVGLNESAVSAVQYSFNQAVLSDGTAILWTPN